jgi:exopolysaccharide biosynthesis polyprenyl glycosylphosphotransferase
MVLALALLEGSLLFIAVSASIFLWLHPLLFDWIDVVTFLSQTLGLSFCCTIAFYYNDLYDFRVVRNFAEFASRLMQAFGVAFILLAIFYTLFPGARIAEGPFFSSFVIVVGFLLPLRAISYAVMRSHLFTERVLILGTSPLARKVVHEIEARPDAGCTIVGVIDDGAASDGTFSRYSIFGPPEQLGKIIEDVHPDRIIVTMAERRGRLPVDELLQSRVRGLTVEDGVAAYERLSGKLAVEALTPSDLIFSKDFRKSHVNLAVARAISLVASLVGCIAFAPLVGLIALAIKLDSRGPIFFVHRRTGLYGRPFTLIKFRTMVPVSSENSEWVRDNHDRVTRVGKWLRKFRLDELPQFVNLLRGDMNLVGPRPHPVSNQRLFIENIPYCALRSLVRPGLTGWAQVRYGYANDLQEEIEKMRYDLYYIKHFSIWFDLRILFDTVKIVLFGRGSREADAYPAGARTEARR